MSTTESRLVKIINFEKQHLLSQLTVLLIIFSHDGTLCPCISKFVTHSKNLIRHYFYIHVCISQVGYIKLSSNLALATSSILHKTLAIGA